ncbi:hypothetical protein BLNAU_11077 [Blattamonas nauphoetae]|uniref:Uncharacterized protein n=1 Tax=Blattamonas nauphoetae TaxID=2049346 RepID=A0ABQ9XQY5_9EUKA|nr:hypothetical protein BLNAU_11077 [Blattamonas nauphoetae]
MEMLTHQIWNSSAKVRLAFIQADLIPQLIITLNPLSLSRADSQEFHVNLLTVISHSVWLATPNGLAELEIYKQDEQQAVHETILKHVLVPSEKIKQEPANHFEQFLASSGQQTRVIPILSRLSPSGVTTLSFCRRDSRPTLFWKAIRRSIDGDDWWELVRDKARLFHAKHFRSLPLSKRDAKRRTETDRHPHPPTTLALALPLQRGGRGKAAS